MSQYLVAKDNALCNKLVAIIGHPAIEACFRISSNITVEFLKLALDDCYDLVVTMRPIETAMQKPMLGVETDMRTVEFHASCGSEALLDFRRFLGKTYGRLPFLDGGDAETTLVKSGVLLNCLSVSLVDDDKGCRIVVSDIPEKHQKPQDYKDQTVKVFRSGRPRPRLELVPS